MEESSPQYTRGLLGSMLGHVKKLDVSRPDFFQKGGGRFYYLLFLLFLIYWYIMSPKPQLLLQEQQIRTVHVITACENRLTNKNG